MKAEPILQEKRILLNRRTEEAAIAELKIWKVPRSKHYPTGQKFSLFLVARGRTIVGIDNHKPKGPHLHLGKEEFPYVYKNPSQLLNDFWDFTRKAGFEP